MKAGKISESVLKRSVLRQIHTKVPEMSVGAAVGGDFAAIAPGEDEQIVFAMHPVTRTRQKIGRSGVIEALNNVACSGAAPVGVMVSLLLPTTENEQQLRNLIQEMDQACQEAGAAIFGGHTEVSRRVTEPLVTITGVGKAKRDSLIKPGGCLPGMDIIATKWVGLEGTAILATEKESLLRERYSRPFLDKAKTFGDFQSILPEAAVAGKSGICAMHDVSEGGIFGALWELAQCSDVGLEIDLKKIPIRQETVEVCEFFDINPYKLISGGCLLLAGEGMSVVRALAQAGIPAAVIGKATAGKDRVVLNEDERRFLELPQTDELYKVIE